MTPDEEKELVRLVELDYERTSKFIEGMVGTSATTRGWAVTVWLAVLGIAVNQRLWALGLLGTAAVFVFALVDLYHSRLYEEAEIHAAAAERISRLRYKRFSRGADDKYAASDAENALRAYSFGVYSNLRAFAWRWNLLRGARPYLVFRAMYPFMAAVGVVVALAIGIGTAMSSVHSIPHPSPTPTATRH
jgi:hypothetical protein